tara:strand:+ start:145 stop:591 length:447 start_codon:yes stop_codon:yes gene_type:complete
MVKAKRLILTNEWVEIKEIFEANTNGNEEYGKNFEIGGELDILTRSFLDRLGDITTLRGYNCVIDDIKMNLWKERIWSIIENAGLLAPIAWKLDIAKQEEIDKKLEEEEKKWNNNDDEFDELGDYEPTDEELIETEKPKFDTYINPEY